MGATTAIFDNGMSPDLPDRKRYAIKANVSLGVYRPSFGIQPDSSQDITALLNTRKGKNSMRLSDEGLNIVSDTSPKIKDMGRGEQ